MRFYLSLFSSLIALSIFPISLIAQDSLQPLMVKTDKLVLSDNFEKPVDKLDKKTYLPRQGTRWQVADGVLHGQQSTPEFQTKKKDHKGLEPRLSVPATPAEFAIQFSVKFSGGIANKVVPFVEFGHHVVRLGMNDGSLQLVADYESVRVAEAKDQQLEFGKWYHMLAELKGDEFVLQIKDGPTMYARHECFKLPAPSGGTGLGVAGSRGGIAELDNIKIWSAKDDVRADWKKRRSTIAEFKHEQIKEKQPHQIKREPKSK